LTRFSTYSRTDSHAVTVDRAQHMLDRIERRLRLAEKCIALMERKWKGKP
jgi:hypothetical protein